VDDGAGTADGSADDHGTKTMDDDWKPALDDVSSGGDDQSEGTADDTGEPKGAEAPFEVSLDLREFQSVRDFLKSKGIHNGSPASEVLQWVPSNIVLRMWPSRVQGRIGADAEGGYLTFNIVSCDGGQYFYAR
jgi:hypothetical protein